MTPVGEVDADGIARPHQPTVQYDTHDPGLAHDPTSVVTVEDGLQEAVAEVVELRAGIAQTGDPHDGFGSQPQDGPSRKVQQVETAGRDVLTQLANSDIEATSPD